MTLDNAKAKKQLTKILETRLDSFHLLTSKHFQSPLPLTALESSVVFQVPAIVSAGCKGALYVDDPDLGLYSLAIPSSRSSYFLSDKSPSVASELLPPYYVKGFESDASPLAARIKVTLATAQVEETDYCRAHLYSLSSMSALILF
jgi:hypothetical protein